MLPLPAVSLCAVDTLIQHPAGLTHRVLDDAARAECGITPGMLRISVGIEYVPDMFSYNNYLQRIRYRGGFTHRTDPRSVDGKQLTEYGGSLGLGFPVILPRQQTSFINLTLEGGRFGAGSPLRETYARMTLGFTLNDNSWFFKRKFN